MEIFIDATYSKPPMRSYPTNKITYNHIDEIWSIDLADVIDFKLSNNKGFRYVFVVFDNFSKYTWCIPIKNQNINTITKDRNNLLLN